MIFCFKTDSCPNQTSKSLVFDDQCFWVINDALRTFDEAQAECRVNGGNLARIPNKETDEILTK